MKRIDKRKTYYCVIDTETCPIEPSPKVDAHNMLVYDIGYRIIDKKGNCYLEKSFVVDEIFHGEYKRMRNSYYVDKLPQYYKEIGENKRIIKGIEDIRNEFQNDLKMFNCTIVSAHNAYFDYTSLRTTMKWLNCKNPYFYKYEYTLWDTMKMARDTICKAKSYPFYNSNGQKSVSAENLYRYISGNYEFTESHTGLEDTRIESAILVKCLSYHKKMKRKLWAD